MFLENRQDVANSYQESAMPEDYQDEQIYSEKTTLDFVSGRPDTSMISHGTVIASYKILRRLGRGGMGTVYLASGRQPSRLVALKASTVVRSVLKHRPVLRPNTRCWP